jgi:RNA recognition motif-containing protein
MRETFMSNIYVSNIPRQVSEQEFTEVMGKAGKITSIKFMEHEKTVNGETFVAFKKGFVCFEDVKQAQKCIQLYDQTNAFGLGHKPLKVDFWQSRDDLIIENEEKNINQVKKIIHQIQ